MIETIPREATAPKEKKVTSKARRGSGSIYRQPGTMNWTIQFYQHGKRIREKTGSDDYRAAQQKLTHRLASIDKGEVVLPARRKPILVEELFLGLEREYIRERRRSLKALKLRWQHLKPVFAYVASTSVTKETIEAYCDKRLAEGAAVATCNREVAALKRMFRRAADRLPRLPVFPKKISERNTRKGFVEGEEYSRLTAHASELWLRAFIEIAFSLCWRRGEILELQVGQVDLRQRILRLEPGSTKNGKGREAPMTEKMYQLLKQCVAGKTKDDFVLTRSRNRQVRDFRTVWKNLCTAAGLPGLLVHDLRRSGARQLRKAGVSESVIMSIGGWETASVFKRYDIISNKDQVLAMDALELKRAADKAALEQEQAENSHSFSHSFASDGKSATETQNQWTQ
jgi:integrase